MATKKRVNAREARREQALGDIVNGMAGAFGDYVRSQLAANPGGQGNFNGNNVVGSGQGNFNGNGPGFNPGQMMGARGPLPTAPTSGVGNGVGNGPGWTPPPMPTPPTMPTAPVMPTPPPVAPSWGNFDLSALLPPVDVTPTLPPWLQALLPSLVPPARRF